MRIGLFIMALNVALNALLIEGRWGLPRLGIEGSAIASNLAVTAGAAVLVSD